MKKSWISVLAAAAVLTGCGGGNDGNNTPSPTDSVPASASESPSGFITYLQLLVVAPADTLEPVDTSAVTPPAEDVGSPVLID